MYVLFSDFEIKGKLESRPTNEDNRPDLRTSITEVYIHGNVGAPFTYEINSEGSK